MVLDSSSRIIIQVKTSSQKVLGTNIRKVDKGVATFDDLAFVSNPGDENIEFKITSDALDSEVIALQYGSQFTQNPIIVNFRYCMPGEEMQNSACVACPATKFSTNWNSISCSDCIDHAVCLGGTEVYVEQGYWRSDKNTTTVYPCLREDS